MHHQGTTWWCWVLPSRSWRPLTGAAIAGPSDWLIMSRLPRSGSAVRCCADRCASRDARPSGDCAPCCSPLTFSLSSTDSICSLAKHSAATMVLVVCARCSGALQSFSSSAASALAVETVDALLFNPCNCYAPANCLSSMARRPCSAATWAAWALEAATSCDTVRCRLEGGGGTVVNGTGAAAL